MGAPGNTSSPVDPFTHGLTGVDQPQNWLLVDALVLSFAVLCIATLIYRLCIRGNRHLRQLLTMTKDSRQLYWTENHSTIWPTLKNHLFYAPLFTKRHNREIQLSSAINVGTLPGRFHTLLLILYAASNIAYCLVLDYQREETASVVAELRGRTGILASINMMPTVLFALRWNPLIGILGVSYDTFNLLHRWAARITIIEALVHTLCWLSNSIQSGGWHQVGTSLGTSTSYLWGMIGTFAFTFVLCQSISPIRHAFYESFLTGHRLGVLFAVIGTYVHLDKANLPQKPFAVIVFLLWGSEYLYRLYTLAWYNVSSQGLTKVRVEALQNEACRVTFLTKHAWPTKPGQHAHIFIPQIGWLGSHPFSVAWTSSPSSNYPNNEPSSDVKAKQTTTITDLDVEKALAEQNFSAPEPKPSTTAVSFICRARTGFTKNLHARASLEPNGIWDNISGAIEGPYGGHDSLDSYGTVVLFAAGVGITHQMLYIRHLLSGYAAGTVSTRKIVLVWSVPDVQCFEWVRPWMDEILAMEGRRECLKMLMFVTRPKNMQDVRSASGVVTMHAGRCNVQEVLDKEIFERTGAMCVTVCGPGAFADGVRQAVRRRLCVGSLDFIEEAFTY
ncbi:MAG: hypothetical protein M1820_005094 [Bogoriella megaspora]|nr:MAG: hypothetical protein M1820_005094 [Bogoriella megaspora]